MTDHEHREAARTALAGDEDGAVRLLAHKIRAWAGCHDCGGDPMQERAQKLDLGNMPRAYCPTCRGLSLRERAYLAAYCGDRMSGQALGLAPCLTCGCFQRGQQITACPRCQDHAWLAGLGAWGEHVLRLAVLAGAWAAWARRSQPAVAQYLELCEAYEAEPTARNADAMAMGYPIDSDAWWWFPWPPRGGPAKPFDGATRLQLQLAEIHAGPPVRLGVSVRLIGWALHEARA